MECLKSHLSSQVSLLPLTPPVVREAYRQSDCKTPVMRSSYAEMEDAAEREEWERINQPEVRKRVQNRLSQRRRSKYSLT